MRAIYRLNRFGGHGDAEGVECGGSDLNCARWTRLNAGDAEGEEGGDEVRRHALDGSSDDFDVFHVKALRKRVKTRDEGVEDGSWRGKTCSTIASSPACSGGSNGSEDKKKRGKELQ